MTDSNSCHSDSRNLVKITDLPIYQNEDLNKKIEIEKKDTAFDSKITDFRKLLSSNLHIVRDAYLNFKGYYYHGKDKFSQTYENLIDEKQHLNKAVAITSGGLVGLIYSLRKSKLKKLFYVGLGVSAASAICYPKETKENKDVALYIAKNKINPLVKEYSGLDLEDNYNSIVEKISELKKTNSFWNSDKTDEKKKIIFYNYFVFLFKFY